MANQQNRNPNQSQQSQRQKQSQGQEGGRKQSGDVGRDNMGRSGSNQEGTRRNQQKDIGGGNEGSRSSER